MYLILEYCEKGCLLSKRYKAFEAKRLGRKIPDILPLDTLKKYFRHLILGLDYLHNFAGVVHRDIKPDNLLVSADDTLKIADFGISEIFEDDDDSLGKNAGTKPFLAPETWKGKTF